MTHYSPYISYSTFMTVMTPTSKKKVMIAIVNPLVRVIGRAGAGALVLCLAAMKAVKAAMGTAPTNPAMYPCQPSVIPTLMANGTPATNSIVKKYRLNAGHMLAEREPLGVDENAVNAPISFRRDAGLVIGPNGHINRSERQLESDRRSEVGVLVLFADGRYVSCFD